MIAIAFLAGCVVWGFALLRLVQATPSRMERTVIAPVLGFATGGFLLYRCASIFGSLGAPAMVTTFIVFAAAALVALRRPRSPADAIPRWFLALAAGVIVVLVAFNLFGVLAPHHGGFWAAEHVWADTPFHTSIITSFAYRDAYPPDYPLALGQPLNYPFLVDFISGTLLRHGLVLRASVIVVNVIVQAAFLLGLALITHRLTSSARAAVASVVVFFLLGNFGWLAVPQDISEAGGFGSWIRDVPWSYTGEPAGAPARERLGTGLHLGNPVFLHLLPRRSAAFGMGAGATLLLLLDDLLGRRRWPQAVLVGLLAGVLPRVHAHTAIVMATVAVVWAGRVLLTRRRDPTSSSIVRTVALAGAIAVVIALPDLLAMRTQTGSFFAFWPGWTGEPRQAFTGMALGGLVGALGETVLFWILNGGALLLLLPIAWLRANDRTRWWYVPFVVVWLVGFLVRTQPWEWDNNNYFVWWQAASVVLVAPLVASWIANRTVVVRGAGVVLAVGLTLGGVLSFVYAGEHRLHLWSKGDMRFAELVREATPRDAIILTANGHTHPVTGLSGRQTVMGYWGWFSAHGLDVQRYEADVAAMLSGDVDRMQRLGIDYVVLGPWEEGQAVDKEFMLGEVFEDPDRFDIVLDETFDGREWKLLRLRDDQNAQLPRT